MTELILEQIHKHNYPLIIEEDFVNIYGLRRVRGEFNDIIATVVYIKGNIIVNTYKATTEPGQGWLWDVMGNKKGTFSLKEGFYRDCWVLGKHKGKYPALTQNYERNIFVGYRDSNKNGVIDYTGKLYDDVLGLNLHTTSLGYTKDWIGKFSAGCQVIFDYKRFMNEFVPLVTKHSELYTYFNYGLMKVDI